MLPLIWSLRSILSHGFLCAPERLDIHPHPDNSNELKRALVAREEPEYTHIQSRMCFTLCEERELFERFARGYVSPSFAGTRPPPASHADLFGAFSLAVDVPAARQIGILPVMYLLACRRARPEIPRARRPPGPPSTDHSEAQRTPGYLRRVGDRRTFVGDRRRAAPDRRHAQGATHRTALPARDHGQA